MAVRVRVKHVRYCKRNSGSTPQDIKRRFADTNVITRQMRREDNYRQSNGESCEGEAMPLVPVQLCLLCLPEVSEKMSVTQQSGTSGNTIFIRPVLGSSLGWDVIMLRIFATLLCLPRQTSGQYRQLRRDCLFPNPSQFTFH
jgi:hypothetical protein